MRAPDFWRRPGVASALLAPAGWLFGFATRLRLQMTTPWRAPVRVLCVGNLVAGGAGKTPVALAVGARLKARGVAVQFLSRGYGGREPGPIPVEPARHSAREVGDEALLLARLAPTWVARDRAAGARAAEATGAQAIVMDDGLQNPHLAKTLALVVVDGGFGFGNARVMPAGPLREPLGRGLARADALVVLGRDERGAVAAALAAAPGPLPVLAARLVPEAAARALAGRRAVAFAGIARPEKFFQSLEEAGVALVARRGFPDHHPYHADELARLRAEAERARALLVTTTKDAVRLGPEAGRGIAVFPVAAVFEEEAALDSLLERGLGRG